MIFASYLHLNAHEVQKLIFSTHEKWCGVAGRWLKFRSGAQNIKKEKKRDVQKQFRFNLNLILFTHITFILLKKHLKLFD